MATIRRRGKAGNLSIRWSYGGKERELSTGLSDTPANRLLAQMTADKIERDILLGEFDESLRTYALKAKVTTRSQVKRTATAPELFKAYTESRRPDLARNSLAKYQGVQANLQRRLPIEADRITPKIAAEFIGALKKSCSAETCQSYLWLIRDCWRWAEAKYAVNTGVWDGVTIARQRQKKRRPYTEDEVAAIVDWFKTSEYYSYYWPFVFVLYHVAARPGEITALKWADVDRGVRFFRIFATKTGKERLIWLPKNVIELIRKRDRGKDTDLVFPAPKGGQILVRTFNARAWKRCIEDLRLRYESLYILRHSKISIMLSRGADPFVLAQNCGHRVDTMLKHYAENLSTESPFD
jgi:integrase